MNMRVSRLAWIAGAMLMTGSVCADAVTNKLYTGGERRAFTNAHDWATMDGIRCDYGPLDPDIDYLVSDKNLSTPNIDRGEAIFGGRSLTLGDPQNAAGAKTGGMNFYPYGTSKLRFNAPGLFLNWGRIYLNWGTSFNLAGQVTVRSTSYDPYGIQASGDNQTLDISAVLLGDDTACLRLLPNGKTGYVVRISNTESDYQGLIRVEGGTAEISPGATPNATLEVGDMTVGSVLVYSGAGISTATSADTVKVGKLELRDNSALVVKSAWAMQDDAAVGSSGKIVVTDALTLASDSTVHVRVPPMSAVPNATTQRVPILQVPYGTGLSTNRFNLVAIGGYFVGNPFLAVDVDQAADTETLVVVSEPIVALAVSDDFSFDAEHHTSALDNASQWSDGQLPHDGAHYYVGKMNNAGMALRTQFVQGGDPYEIKGLSLTFDDGCGFYALRKIKCARLRLTKGSSLTNGQWVTPIIITGGFFEVIGDVNLRASDTHTIVINSVLEGSGRLIASGMRGTSARQGNLQVNGDNCGYTGTYRLSTLDDPGDPGSDTQEAGGALYQTIRFASAAALGAPFDAFTPQALTLHNWGTIRQDVSVDFTDTSRGLYVDGRGQIIVAEGQSVALRADTTYYGELRKRGLGCLAMGGTARFDSEAQIGLLPLPGSVLDTEPQAGSNLLTVTQGDLKALTPNCLNGVRVKFTNADSALRLNVDTEDLSMLSTGVVNVKESVPFAFAGATLPIQLELGGAQPVARGERMEIGLLTVTSAAAESLRGKVTVRAANGTFAAKRRLTVLDRTDSSTGNVTFYCQTEEQGIQIIFR